MMSYGWGGGWAPYLTVAQQRREADRRAALLRKQGRQLAPVRIAGRRIASTFWGKAWGENLEAYQDYESRLPRGRSYARNGAVIDLQIESGQVRALVSGSELYETRVTIRAMAAPAWRKLCADCAGGIDSLVELLQGRFSKAVMQLLCRQEAGLFPRPAEIRFACSCPDHAAMCKHVAATLYGVGARFDEQPELLFILRGVEGAELLAGAVADMPFAAGMPNAGRVLHNDDVAALFGIDVATTPATNPPRARLPAGRPARAADAGSKTGGTQAAKAGRSAAAKIGKKKNAAASRVAPPAKPSAATMKKSASKVIAGARSVLPAPKPVKINKPPLKPATPVASTSAPPKPSRDRAEWPWKLRAAARKGKRS